jgi:NADH-quinone oxidoreductase subunit C
VSSRLERLQEAVTATLGDRAARVTTALGELTVEVPAAKYHEAAQLLRDAAATRFDLLVDLCGVDYSAWGDGVWDGLRYAAVLHLLSIEHNWRVRLRTFATDDDFPVVDSVVDVWPAANWFEREAFDLFGIIFTGHDDLRRLLTDYGFVGHPFRKDFPLSGNVEMRYDGDEKRVVYQPVSIEPREITPRVIRESAYGIGGEHHPFGPTPSAPHKQ